MPISILWRQKKSIPKTGKNAVGAAGNASSHRDAEPAPNSERQHGTAYQAHVRQPNKNALPFSTGPILWLQKRERSTSSKSQMDLPTLEGILAAWLVGRNWNRLRHRGNRLRGSTMAATQVGMAAGGAGVGGGGTVLGIGDGG